MIPRESKRITDAELDRWAQQWVGNSAPVARLVLRLIAEVQWLYEQIDVLERAERERMKHHVDPREETR